MSPDPLGSRSPRVVVGRRALVPFYPPFFVRKLTMAKSSRRRNRNRVRPATPPSQRQGNGPPPARPFIDLEKRLDSIELPLLNVGPDVVPDPDSGSTPPPETPTGGSRANSLKNALRSRVLFPIEMKELIDRLFRDFARDLKPVGSLSEWLVYELARSKLQADLACDRLTVDEGRIVERAGTSFDSDQTVRANTLGARLSKQPQLVSGALEATKFGTLYLVKQYEFLDDIVRSNGCLNDKQLEVLGDLLGIDHVYRPGCGRIPAGTDTQALTSLIARELGRLRGNLPASAPEVTPRRGWRCWASSVPMTRRQESSGRTGRVPGVVSTGR